MTLADRAQQRLLISGGVHAVALRTPAKIALICEQEQFTYAQLSDRIRRVCGAAIALGIRRGDRVALLAPNCVEYPELVCGLSDAGAIVATLSSRSTLHEVAQACADCGPRLLIAHPSSADIAAQVKTHSSTIERLVVLGEEYDAWIDSADAAPPRAEIDESDPFTLVYSSGTTGKPKGIVISHRSRTLTFHAMAMEYGCYGPDDWQLSVAPMAHGAGFAYTMASLYFGGTVETLPKFDAERVLHKLSTDPATGIFLVPTHFQAIFALDGATLARYDGKPAALRTIMSNAAALPQAIKEKVVGYFGHGLLHETYGATEAGIVTNLRPQFQLERKHSVGPSFALNHVRLLDEQGAEVATGEVGELHCKSPYLFNGYWGKPDETRQALRHDGWLTVGDLARCDQQGFYYIVDRKSDMVISGGMNVYPREIEEALATHPAIREAAVIGRPDDYWGQVLECYFVSRPDMQVSASQLDTHCRATLSAYKVPKKFTAIDALPRNASGKVLKVRLREAPPDTGTTPANTSRV